MLTLFVSNTISGLASPFLPQVFEKRGIESVWTGVIFGVFTIAVTLSSLLIGKYLDSIGHRNVIIFASLQIAVSISLFGFINDLQKELIVPVSIVLRVTQGKLPVISFSAAVQPGFPMDFHFAGSASGMIDTASYSFASQANPE